MKAFSQYLLDKSGRQLISMKINPDNRLADFDLYLEWTINQILYEVYRIRVMNHYKNDLFNCIYRTEQLSINQAFTGWMGPSVLDSLAHVEVRTLINGRDLFITKRAVY
jgi:hypothetical protein